MNKNEILEELSLMLISRGFNQNGFHFDEREGNLHIELNFKNDESLYMSCKFPESFEDMEMILRHLSDVTIWGRFNNEQL